MKLLKIDMWVCDAGRLNGTPVTRFTLGPGEPGPQTLVGSFLNLLSSKNTFPTTFFLDILQGTPDRELKESLEIIRSNTQRIPIPIMARSRSAKPLSWAPLVSWLIRQIDPSLYGGAQAHEYHFTYNPRLTEDPFVRNPGDTTSLYLLVTRGEDVRKALQLYPKLLRANAWQLCVPPLLSISQPIKLQATAEPEAEETPISLTEETTDE